MLSVLLIAAATCTTGPVQLPEAQGATRQSAADAAAKRKQQQLRACFKRANRRPAGPARKLARKRCQGTLSGAGNAATPGATATPVATTASPGTRSTAPPVPSAPVPATPPLPDTPALPTNRLFAPTSFWNAPLPAVTPLDPRSDQLVAALAGQVQSEIAAGSGPWINFDSYSVPVYTVGPEAPRVRVTLDVDVPELQRDFDAVPIPVGARAAAGSDAHMTVYQPATDTMWEFWLARPQADGWHARWGGKMTRVSLNQGYFPNSYGATATSLPLLGGLMTIKELEAGKINHALALAVPNTDANSFTWPAQRGDGRTSGPRAIPEGTHFRIDPSVHLGQLGLTPLGLMIARAAQRYGIVVRDTSSVTVFYAEDPVATPGDPYGRIFGGDYPNRLLAGFPWDRLQVVAPRGV